MTTDEKFTAWMAKVDKAINKLTGLTSSDLPDVAYRDMFEDKRAPSAAARVALVEAGW